MRDKKDSLTTSEEGEETVVAAVDVSDSREIIMDIKLAFTERLSENQLDKAQEFYIYTFYAISFDKNLQIYNLHPKT